MTEQMQECRSCGAPDARVVEVSKQYMAPFGKSVSYQQAYTDCAVCGEKVDVSAPEAFPEAIRAAEINSVDEVLKYLKEHGITHGQIERCLELPNRQVSNWKSKETWSKSALAVLRITRAYPWILEVAEKHFDPTVVRAKLLEAAREEQKMVSQFRTRSGNFSVLARVSMQSDGGEVVVEQGRGEGQAEYSMLKELSPFTKMMASGALAATTAVVALAPPRDIDVMAVLRPPQVVHAVVGLDA